MLCTADWTILNPSTGLTIDVGIAFPKDGDVAYIAGDSNAGPQILKTTDGGVSFAPCNITNVGLDVFLLDIAASGTSIVVSSIAGELFSVDGGNTFHQSIGGGSSQSVRHLGISTDDGHKYGCAGTYRGKAGVAITVNSGRTFSIHPAGAGLYASARYGAFPTDSVWYIAAGDWPTDSEVPAHRRTKYLNKDGSLRSPPRPDTPSSPAPPIPVGYQAQLAKTEDGGVTFTSVFAQNNTYYFNGIDCALDNAAICCAVAERAEEYPTGKAVIVCTQDGGKSWNETFVAMNTQTAHYSLMELRYSSATDVWAVGAIISATGANGWFVHSTDGGRTWLADPNLLHNYYAFGVDMLSTTEGFASVGNIAKQVSGLAKFSA